MDVLMKALCRGMSLCKMALCKGISLCKRPLVEKACEKALCKGISLSEIFCVKGFPYGKGSLQRDYIMSKALCKGIGNRFFVKEVPYGKGSL